MSNLADALAVVGDRLLRLASDDVSLRRELRALAQELLAALDELEKPVEAPPEPRETAAVCSGPAEGVDATVTLPATETSEPEPVAAAPVRLPELTLGRSPSPAEAPEPPYRKRWTAPDEIDLQLVERRCRLKAEGARWAAIRRRLISDAADYETEVAPKDRDIISRAKALPDCFLWMNHSTAPSPSNPKQYDEVAVCFETLADAIALVRKVQNDSELSQREFEQSLDLLAEAQSALRTAVERIDASTDTDQAQVFNWLKATTSEAQIFIQRHMRADDPAFPENSGALAARIEDVDSRLEEHRRRSNKRRKLLGKVRHKLTLLDEQPEAAEDHWKILVATVDELIADGMPPSNRELRELLVPYVDDLRDVVGVTPNVQLVLREIDRYLSTYPPAAAKKISRTTPEVQQAARLLEGRTMVLIGGERRPSAEKALQDAFALRELIWIETKDHQSVDIFEPYVSRPEVAVVVLAIRWTSHSYGNVKDFCERHGKPLVRLPAGYSPNQVAAQIMSQCSERLGNSERT